jgi:hypothetical protein
MLEVPSSKFQVPSSKFKVPSSKFKVPSSRFKVSGSRFKIPGSKVQGSKFQPGSLKPEACSLPTLTKKRRA